MSREIKFRAWDGIRMWPVQRLTWATLDYDLFAFEEGSDRLNSNLKLMQYTGLEDKNGIEVYEGDILAGNWTVVWHEGGFYLHIPELFDNTLYVPMSESQEFEVIGNIYENPELVKEVK